MKPRFTTSFALSLATAFLSGCASTYVPYASADAALVRLRLVSPSLTAFAAIHVRTVDSEAQCSAPTSLRSISQAMDAEAIERQRQRDPTRLPDMPREPMAGSPARTDASVAEFRFAPRPLVFTGLGAIGYLQCAVTAQLDAEPGGQYELQLHIDGAQQHCHYQARKWDTGGGQWVSHALSPARCDGPPQALAGRLQKP